MDVVGKLRVMGVVVRLRATSVWASSQGKEHNMAQSPWKQGDRGKYWPFGLQPDTGFFDVTGLTPSDFTLVFLDANGNERDGDGIFTNITAATSSSPATVTYQQSATDVARVGTFDRRVVIRKGTPQQETFEFGAWVCER
jgi:hypothetical protein